MTVSTLLIVYVDLNCIRNFENLLKIFIYYEKLLTKYNPKAFAMHTHTNQFLCLTLITVPQIETMFLSLSPQSEPNGYLSAATRFNV